MASSDARTQWEGAAPGWARWEATIAAWLEPATERMLDMAGVGEGARVIDLACGAGSQTLRAAARVGSGGRVVASDIAETMLRHVEANARAAGFRNVETLAGAAETLGLPADDFDAAICRLGLMLFDDPARAATAMRRVLRPGGRLAAVVFTTPAANPFMAKPMEILLRHAGKAPPPPGRPGIFALGAPGVIARLLTDAGFVAVGEVTVPMTLHLGSAADALRMMQEAFGAYRAVIAGCDAATQAAAWRDVGDLLRTFEAATGFSAPGEVVVAAGVKPPRA